MRNIYLVCYDVSNPKRLRRMFKTMRGFGDPLQYSVFVCVLSPTERALLIGTLDELIHHTEDRVVVVNLGGADGSPEGRIEFLGRRAQIPERQAVVV
jgi:CRISPR-associated protein Cas2